MLSSSRFSEDPRNHCVPILDYFVDEDDTSISYMVMPFLRLTNNPPFETVNDIIDFGNQLLQVCGEIRIAQNTSPILKS